MFKKLTRYKLKEIPIPLTPEQKKILDKQRNQNIKAICCLIKSENKIFGKQKPKLSIRGKTRCPLCTGDISYIINTNGKISGMCETEGCFSWKM